MGAALLAAGFQQFLAAELVARRGPEERHDRFARMEM